MAKNIDSIAQKAFFKKDSVLPTLIVFFFLIGDRFHRKIDEARYK